MVNKIKPAKGFHRKVKIPEQFTTLDQTILKSLETSTGPDVYQEIFKYFCEGIFHYRTASYSSIIYPGESGTRGILIEGLEGFARTSTPLACWMQAENEEVIQLSNNSKFNVKEHLIKGLENGTNPNSEGYWGDMVDNDQRIVEAADIAISLFILLNTPKFEFNQKEQVIRWLSQTNAVESYKGNWLLFRVVINLVAESISDKNNDECMQRAIEAWDEFKGYYQEDGWFADGDMGKLDYYNVWQMQYMLFWVSKVNPAFDTQFIENCIIKFSSQYKYFISTEGVPIYGRSCSYRFAAAVPFLCKALVTKANIDFSFAHKANHCIWQFYAKKGGLKHASMTQGYFEKHADVLENYSGRASPLWGLRSLSLAIIAFSNTKSVFKTVNLPIEEGDYSIKLSSIGATIIGDKMQNSIIVRFDLNQKNAVAKFKSRNWMVKILEKVLCRPLRVENMNSKYNNPEYSNKELFFNTKQKSRK